MIDNNSISFKLSPEYVMGGYTAVDNMFICEYLKNLDGNDVKLYIYSLYIAHTGIPTDIEQLKRAVGLMESEIISSFEKLDEEGVLSLISKSPIEVTFKPLLNSFSKPRKIKPGKYDEFNRQLQSILSKRMLSPNEYTDCYNFIELYHMEKEAFLLIASHYASLKGAGVSIQYIIKASRTMAYNKRTTLKSVETWLEEYRLQQSFIGSIVKKMGLKRQVELEDGEFARKWKELGFEEEALITASSLIKGAGASMQKLDNLVRELYGFKKFTSKEILLFNQNKLEMKTLAININKALSVYYESLDAEINNYILKWVELGFSDDMLVRLADFCFMNDLRSLSKMDENVRKFHRMGIVTLKSFDDYIIRVSQKDIEIKELFEVLAIERKINAYDRKTYMKYEDMGFTKDMILKAGELSRTASNPYPYMQSILINWKSANIFSIDKIPQGTQNKKDSSTKSKAKEINSHSYTKDQLNAVYTAIEDIDF